MRPHRYMPESLLSVLALIGTVLITPSASAAFALTHDGLTDPSTEGFSLVTCCGTSSIVGALANDQGLAAWSVASSNSTGQIGYTTGITAGQVADITNGGFRLEFRARAVQNAAAAYNTGTPVTFAVAGVDTGQRRYDVALGADANGDTVAVLVDVYAGGGPGGALLTPGQSFTLVGSGSSYHLFDLIYNPATLVADLFVDGTKELQGYSGHASFVTGSGLGFGAYGAGQGNFNLVQLSSPVPLPAAAWLLGSALGGIGFARRRA